MSTDGNGGPPIDPLESLTHPIVASQGRLSSTSSSFSLSPRSSSLIQDDRLSYDDPLGIACGDVVKEAAEETNDDVQEYGEKLSDVSANEGIDETWKETKTAQDLQGESHLKHHDHSDSLDYSFNSLNSSKNGDDPDDPDDDASCSSLAAQSVTELSRLLTHASNLVKATSSLDEHDRNTKISALKKQLRKKERKMQKMIRSHEQKEHNFFLQLPSSSTLTQKLTSDVIEQVTPKSSNSNEIVINFNNQRIVLPSLKTKDIEQGVTNLSKKPIMPKAPFSFHCTICYDAFHPTNRAPIVLPCGHTFICEDCGKRLTKCMECRKPTKSVFLSSVLSAGGMNNSNYGKPMTSGSSAFSSPLSTPQLEHPQTPSAHRNSALHEDNPTQHSSSGYTGVSSGAAAGGIAYSPRRYSYATSGVSPRRGGSPMTIGGEHGGGVGNVNRGMGPGNPPQASPSVLASLPTIPFPKNLAMIGMMEACLAQQNALKSIESCPKKSLGGKGKVSRNDDSDSDSEEEDEEEEEDVYESGDDDDNVNFSLGSMHWTGAHGTYAVKDEAGVVVLPKCPQEGLFPDYSTSAVGGAGKPESKDMESNYEKGEPYLIQCGALVQIVDVQSNVAKLARGRGFIVAESSQMLKVGAPRDELCQIEGMLHASHYRRLELLSLLQSSILLEQGLVNQYQMTAEIEHQRRKDNQLAWAATKRLQERATAASPTFNKAGETENSGFGIGERIIPFSNHSEAGDDNRDYEMELDDKDPVVSIPSISQMTEMESIRLQTGYDSECKEATLPAVVTSCHDKKQSSANPTGTTITIAPTQTTVPTNVLSEHQSHEPSNPHTIQPNDPSIMLGDSIAATEIESSSILGCGSFFALETEDVEFPVRHPTTPQRTQNMHQISPSSQHSDSPNQCQYGSSFSPRLFSASPSFDSVDFRTGRSGHKGLNVSCNKKSPMHHNANHVNNTTTSSIGVGNSVAATPSRLMSEHRGIAPTRRVGGTVTHVDTLSDPSWFSPFQAVSRIVLGGGSSNEAYSPSSPPRENRNANRRE